MDHSSSDGYREMEERILIRDTSRNLKKYGSTSRHMIRNDNLIKHIVDKNDTLAGIALKYSVTTEQIRMTNKLFASDSLFLREYLMIPVPKELNKKKKNDNLFDNNLIDNNLIGANCLNKNNDNKNNNDDENSIDNFLAKMDSSIATVKNDIKKSQEHSSFCTDEEDWYLQRHKYGARNRHSNSQSSSTNSATSLTEQYKSLSSDNVHELPSAVVMTNGKKLKNSLQKLQQHQDEIFQL